VDHLRSNKVRGGKFVENVSLLPTIRPRNHQQASNNRCLVWHKTSNPNASQNKICPVTKGN